MANKSKIAKLPPQIREECDRLIRDGQATIDQIVATLRGMGAQVSRTSVGDYKKKMDTSLARYKEAQEVAGVWLGDLKDQQNSKTGQLLAELLKTVAFRTLADMQGQDAGAEPQDLMLLARAIKDMAGAQKADLEFKAKLRSEWKVEMEERATAAADQVTKETRAAGLSEDVEANIRRIVMGVVS
jgi:hypothetical protein